MRLIWFVAAWLGAFPVLAEEPPPRLVGVSQVEQGCPRETPVKVWESFDLAGRDPSEWLLVRTVAGVSERFPIVEVGENDHAVHAYCAAPGQRARVTARFARIDGSVTAPLDYDVVLPSHVPGNLPPRLRDVGLVSRYQQFPIKNGLCCWHFAYLRWNWEGGPFTTFSLPVVVERDIHGGSPFYLQFHGKLSGVPFYFGAITQREKKGDIILFSRWGSQDIADIRVSGEDGYSEVGSHEGEFVGVRKPFRWWPGRYTFQLGIEPEEGGAHFWVRLVVSRDGELPVVAGSLRFPGSIATLSSLTVTPESFKLRHRANVWEIPSFDYRVGPLSINGRVVHPKAKVSYPDRAPRVAEVVEEQGQWRIKRIEYAGSD